MKAAPYTRETLARIRAGASAADLGWDVSFYRTVCRRHEIEPVEILPSKPVADAPYTPPTTRPAPPPRLKSHRRPSLPKARPNGGTYPVPLNGRVDEEMARAVHNFAARKLVSMLEAQRMLLQAGLDAFNVEGGH